MVTAINPFPVPVPANLDLNKQGIVSQQRRFTRAAQQLTLPSPRLRCATARSRLGATRCFCHLHLRSIPRLAQRQQRPSLPEDGLRMLRTRPQDGPQGRLLGRASLER